MPWTVTTPLPDKLNGYPVERSERHRNCATILCKLRDDEFVVATWWPELKDAWQWGHYSTTRATADDDFKSVAHRNALR